MQEKLRKNSFCTFDERRPRGIFEWIDDYQKNKPQTNALVAGVMLMVCGGQSIGWGIFNNHLQAQSWAGGYEDEFTVFWAIICWFIAGIAGFVTSTIVVNKYSKISIYVCCSILSAIGGALLMYKPESIYFIFPSRIIAGFSHGIAYPTVLIHASEVAIPRLRGTIVSLIHFCLMIGVFNSSSSIMPVQQTKTHEVDPTRTMGINALICIATGVIIAIFLNRESPVFLIRKYRDEEAINIMQRLRSESHETADIRQDFHEFKLMVMEDGKSNLNIFGRFNRWPLFVVTIMKTILVASFNMPLNLIWLEAAELKFYDGINDTSGMWLIGVRWMVILVMMFVIDLKRIKVYIISASVSGFILLLLVLVIDSSPFVRSGEVFNESIAIFILAFAFAFQLFSGIAVGMIADLYAVEAFDTRKKPLSIAFTSIVEFLLQILMVTSFFYIDIPLLAVIGISGFTMMLGIFVFIVPDTSNLSLRNARNKFRE